MRGGGQLDMFMVTAVDPPWRDNRDAMGYPFLALQKRRTKAIRYSDANVSLMVSAPAEFGIATVWDWDVMIFAASHINEAIENRRKISPKIAFVPHDCLKQIGRGTGGHHYRLLADAIRRLHATMVITDIREADQPGCGEEQGFHWLRGYSLPKKYSRRIFTTPDSVTHITPEDPDGEPDPARPWVIRIHPWIYNAIVRRGDILAVHPDYFHLTGGLERWLYRLARKAVPDKADPPAIRFKMETLHARSGVTRDLRRFAADIRKLADAQPLPEYGVQIEYRKGQRELVTLYRDTAKPARPPRGRRLKTIQGEQVEPAVNVDVYVQEEPQSFVIEPDSLPAITPRPAATVEQITPTDLVLAIPPEIPEEELSDYLDDEYLDEPPPTEPSPEPASLPPLFRLFARHRDLMAAILDMPSLGKILVSAEEVDAHDPGLLRVKTAARRLVQEAEPLYRDFAIVEFEDVPAEAKISREEWDEWRQSVQQTYEKASALEHRLNALHHKTTPPSRTT